MWHFKPGWSWNVMCLDRSACIANVFAHLSHLTVFFSLCAAHLQQCKKIQLLNKSNFFAALFVLSFCPFDISVDVRDFVIGLSQISSFFSCICLMMRPFFPELVMSTDLLNFEHSSVLLFCFRCSVVSKGLEICYSNRAWDIL